MRMDRTRLKNIILLILLLVNLVLLASLAGLRAQERASRERTAAELTELCASEDIALRADIPSALPPASVTLNRDQETDRALASALLGDDLTFSDEGGGIYVFSCSAGEALFRSGGGFEVTGLLAQTDAEAVCRKFCETFGYQDLILTVEDGQGTGSATQYFDGYPVANASVEFVISGGSLVSVSGVHLPQTASGTADGGSMSAVTALTRFLNARRAGGAVVSSLTEVYLCYELQSTAAAPMSLTPAWCVVTNAGNYYVNCMTESVTRS